MIFVDASTFGYDVGDHLSSGETVGVFKGRPVLAPFDSVIQSVSFDSEEHVLTVVLVKACTPRTQAEDPADIQ
jgi:hypothetical protein